MTVTMQEKRNQAHTQPTNPILTIADPKELKMAITEMFHAYVWQCTGRNEEDHETICAVFHGLIFMIDQLPSD